MMYSGGGEELAQNAQTICGFPFHGGVQDKDGWG